jgi:hypothetical protein
MPAKVPRPELSMLGCGMHILDGGRKRGPEAAGMGCRIGGRNIVRHRAPGKECEIWSNVPGKTNGGLARVDAAERD